MHWLDRNKRCRELGMLPSLFILGIDSWLSIGMLSFISKFRELTPISLCSTSNSSFAKQIFRVLRRIFHTWHLIYVHMYTCFSLHEHFRIYPFITRSQIQLYPFARTRHGFEWQLQRLHMFIFCLTLRLMHLHNNNNNSMRPARPKLC